MSDVVVSVQGLRKVYGANVAVDCLSFEVRRGEIFALLGPNGSGKTTTLESLEGLRRTDGGRLLIEGLEPARQQRRLRGLVGVQLQTFRFPAAMTVEEAMLFFSSYHGVKPRMDLVERLGLAEKRTVQYGKLSVGQQRRLALAIAIAHGPRVVFLDEPTAGLDVQSRVDLHDIARDLREKGSTVILATHDMAEAETLADRAAILLRGRIVAMGSPRELTAAGDSRTRISIATEKGSLLGGARTFPFAAAQPGHDGYALFLSENPGRSVTAILSWLEEKGDALRDLRVERPSLEERFLELTSGASNAATKGAAL